MNNFVSLEVTLSLDMLEVVTSVVSYTAKAYGLEESAVNNAILASEEVFVYLISHPGDSPGLRIRIKNGGYFIKISFIFSPTIIPAHLLNLSSENDQRDLNSLEGLEIFIAGRIADRFIYDRSSQLKTKIHLIIEKKYPERIEFFPPPSQIPKTVAIRQGLNLEIKQASSRIITKYGNHAPNFFRYPGKVVDMIASGDLQNILVTDGKGVVLGSVFWKQNERLIDMYGPYLFVEEQSYGEDLVQSMLETVGRSGAISVINRSPTREVPVSWFEELPCLSTSDKVTGSESALKEQRPLYRDLGEDSGTSVIVHSALVSAVKNWYSLMFMMRQVIPVNSAGEHLPEKTTYYVDIEKNQNRALLTSCLIGEDAADTLRKHLSILQEQGISNIMYEMDLSREDDAALYPVLKENGFSPEYILPWGGERDTLIFRFSRDTTDV